VRGAASARDGTVAIVPDGLLDVLADEPFISVGSGSREPRGSGAQIDQVVRAQALKGPGSGLAAVRLPTWSGVFGPDMAGDVLLPGPDARIAPTTFDEWLAGDAISR
jgi:hypothetical protein